MMIIIISAYFMLDAAEIGFIGITLVFGAAALMIFTIWIAVCLCMGGDNIFEPFAELKTFIKSLL